MSLTNRIPGMVSGKYTRNLLLSLLYLALLPIILVLGIFVYLPLAVATNRHNLSDRLAASPLGAIPTVSNGGIQSAVTIFIGVLVIFTVLGAAAPAADTNTEIAGSPDSPDETPTSGDGSETSASGVTADSTADSESDSPSDETEPSSDSSESDDSGAGEGSTDDPGPFTVDVIDVVDGDTIEIAFENGSTETVRLLGVDTPEVNADVSPDEFEGVPDTEAGRQCLRDYGEQATAYAEDRLSNQTVILELDDRADRRGSFGRLLAYVIIEDQNFNYDLVDAGYARVFDTTFSQSDRFYDAEAAAQDSESGLWECKSVTTDDTSDGQSGDGLRIVRIHADAAGDEYENLNDEYLVFENAGDDPLDLSGWSVEDEADHTYRFPSGFTLQSGDEVTLHTGSGQDSSTDLYWGSGRPVWNNAGDTVFVNDTNGKLVLERSYNG